MPKRGSVEVLITHDSTTIISDTTEGMGVAVDMKRNITEVNGTAGKKQWQRNGVRARHSGWLSTEGVDADFLGG